METQSSSGSVILLIELAILVLMIAACWKVFTKAGQPGWATIIPFYNLYVFLTIAGKPGWWLILFFIPIVNLVMGIIVTVEVARRFGKGGGFAAGLILLPIVFYPILGFGGAQYSPEPSSGSAAQS
jgi:hypothetical protein